MKAHAPSTSGSSQAAPAPRSSPSPDSGGIGAGAAFGQGEALEAATGGWGNGFAQAQAFGAGEPPAAPATPANAPLADAGGLRAPGEVGEGIGEGEDWLGGAITGARAGFESGGILGGLVGGMVGGLTGSTPVRISVSNEHGDAATGANFNRTTVGIGEKCNFDAMVDGQMGSGGTWSCTGGTGSMDPDGFYNWQAPGTPGTFVVMYTQGGATGTVTMTVLAPRDVTSTVANTIPSTRAGAGMLIDLTILPTAVSFAHVSWYEVPTGPEPGTGYFTNRTIGHGTAQGAGTFVPMGADNKGVQDTAQMTGWPGPWSPGVHTWTIPTHYKADNGPSTLFKTVPQVFTVTDNLGNSTISKYGSSA
jgi:hypothetical protein